MRTLLRQTLLRALLVVIADRLDPPPPPSCASISYYRCRTHRRRRRPAPSPITGEVTPVRWL